MCSLGIRAALHVSQTLSRGLDALGVGMPDPCPPEVIDAAAQAVRDQSSEQALTDALFRQIMRVEYGQPS
jgi:hypothetical protein